MEGTIVGQQWVVTTMTENQGWHFIVAIMVGDDKVYKQWVYIIRGNNGRIQYVKTMDGNNNGMVNKGWKQLMEMTMDGNKTMREKMRVDNMRWHGNNVTKQQWEEKNNS